MFDYTLEPGKKLMRDFYTAPAPVLVSIITPFYNAFAYFEQTFNCVINQCFPFFEWLIVNDGSTNTEDVNKMEALAAKDARIRVIHQENQGLAGARRTGFQNAAADIVIPLDADDLITPNYVEMTYWALYYNKDAAFAFTDSANFMSREYLWQKKYEGRALKYDNILTATAAIRKSDYVDVGGYDQVDQHFFEDWSFWIKMVANGKYPVQVPQIAFWYRRNDNGELSKAKQNKSQHGYLNELKSRITKPAPPVLFPRVNGEIFSAPSVSNFPHVTNKPTDKMHALFLIPWMVTGGADKFNLDLITKLDASRFSKTVMTALPADDPLQQLFEQAADEVLPLWAYLDLEPFAEYVSYYIKSRKIDVLFVTNASVFFGMLPWLREQFPDLPIIDYVHMEEWYWRSGGHARHSASLNDMIDKTCVCNERTRKVMLEAFHCRPDSVETVYIGVDDAHFDPATIAVGQARAEMNVSADQKIVLFPCRLHEQKRPYLMLEIANAVKQHIPDVVFAVIGDGPEMDMLRKKANAMSLQKTVLFLGMKSEMRPYYRDADVTLICSIKEGLALTAYESLSMAVPVISSDVGGQGELIDDKVGKLLPLMQDEEKDLRNFNYTKEEIAQYADAIIAILSDPVKREQLGHAGRERIQNGFSLDDMAKNMQHIFENAVSDQAALMERQKVSCALKQTGLAAEYLMQVTEYEKSVTYPTLIATTSQLKRTSDLEKYELIDRSSGPDPFNRHVIVVDASTSRVFSVVQRISRSRIYRFAFQSYRLIRRLIKRIAR